MIKKIGLVLITALAFSCQTAHKKQDEKPPNVIIVLTDDQGYKDVGFNGCTDIPTPNIDRIAENGVVFTNGYVSYPVCGPSRAGLITGRYQERFGFGRNPLFAPNDPNQGLPLTEETLADALDKVGYQTMAIGKWHLGAHESQRPLKRGFDEFFGFLTGGHKYFPENWTLDDISGVKSQFDAYKTKLLKNNTRVDEQEYLTDALSREAVQFIERNAENPFFLYLAYNAPHTPLQATEKYLDRFKHIKNKKRKTYAAMVSSVDDGVGNVLDKLVELDLHENTIVFFLSDNGGPYKTNGSNNDPLREGKGSLYEGGIRVPFAVQWPKNIPRGKRYDKAIISFDIFATAAACANTKTKNDLDGVNLVPFLSGEKKGVPHEQLFWRKYDANDFATRSGNLKSAHFKGGENEMYNLSQDISETNQLSSNKEFQKMNDKSEEWLQQLKAPAFLGLMQNEEYNKTHPNRFVIKPY